MAHRLKIRSVVLFAFLFEGLFALTGACYQALAFRLDTQRLSRPGRLVNVGKIRLNLHCTGQGALTVVLESGLGDALDSWFRVQPEIARFSRVCSYDRAGYGYSEPGPMPRTSRQVAAELHEALRSGGEKPPYVLVGHSFGGYNVRVFNGRYPGEVAGLVLVDATQEDQYRLLPKVWADMGAAVRERARKQTFWAPIYIDLGIARLQLRLQGQQVPPLLLQSKYIRARASELLSIEESADQARAAGHINDKPLVVLTAGRPVDSSLRAVLSERDCSAYQATWVDDLQLRLARLSTRSKRVVVPNTGHDMPSERPDAIASALRELCALVNQR